MKVFKSRSVSSILKGFNKMVAELNAVAELKELEADQLNDKIEALAEQRYAAIDERTAAVNAAAKIEALIS